VLFDGKLYAGHATAISRVWGIKLKSSREIRITSVFWEMPSEFLSMIVARELAHLKEHKKTFYQLCRHMKTRYHQLEFNLRA